ncbi:hypothetical protein DFH29DRAFT_879600 [Suillus ampliporus]|nr:hypothetical protein DFH29DRAFT_879600 [Suillus ampliporus]
MAKFKAVNRRTQENLDFGKSKHSKDKFIIEDSHRYSGARPVLTTLTFEMNRCYIDRLSDDVLHMIFELVCKEDQATFYEYSMQNEWRGRHWDDWYRDYNLYQYLGQEGGINGRSDPPPSTLIAAMGVCKHWDSLLSQTPSLWTVLQISFGDGATSLERVRTFLQHSGTHPLKITLLWNDPENPFNGAPHRRTSSSHDHAQSDEIVGALILSSSFWSYMLIELTPDPLHHGLSLFPGSTSPICDLILFGISWTWPSPSIFSSHLVNLRIHYCMDDHNRNSSTTTKALSQLLGVLVNLQTLALELEMSSIELPHLHYPAIKSPMTGWTADFFCKVYMPNLRILILDGLIYELMLTETDFELFLEGLARLADIDTIAPTKVPSSSFLELDELHLINFSHCAHPASGLFHRLYKQLASVKVLTLGPGAEQNDEFAMALLPTPNGLPLPGLQTLIVFDVPNDIMRRIVLERLSLASPLKELYHHEVDDREEDEDVPDDWQHQVEKYHRIGHPKSDRYCDIVDRQWSYIT